MNLVVYFETPIMNCFQIYLLVFHWWVDKIAIFLRFMSKPVLKHWKGWPKVICDSWHWTDNISKREEIHLFWSLFLLFSRKNTVLTLQHLLQVTCLHWKYFFGEFYFNDFNCQSTRARQRLLIGKALISTSPFFKKLKMNKFWRKCQCFFNLLY